MTEAQIPCQQDQIAYPSDLENLGIRSAPKAQIPDILNRETGSMETRRQRAWQILVNQESSH